MSSKAGHIAFLRFRVNRHNWKTQAHTGRLFVDYSALSNSVFISTIPATKRRSRTCATRAIDVIFKRKHCSRRHRHTHRLTLRRRIKAQTKRGQSDVKAGTVTETKYAGTQGRAVAGFTGGQSHGYSASCVQKLSKSEQ